MKRFIVAALLVVSAICCSRIANAQTRVLAGVSGGDSFNNYSFGVSGALEIPFAKHFELDLKDTFSPIEKHVALGTGRANISNAGGHIWLTKSFGVNGAAEYSTYNVTKVSKGAAYAFGGIIYRRILFGSPVRLSFDYIRQFNNGITKSGVESSHLQGASIKADVRMGCSGPVCFRLVEDFVMGKVFTQGNPQCDGSYGAVTCPRGSAFGGGFTGSFYLEFPRRKSTENEAF